MSRAIEVIAVSVVNSDPTTNPAALSPRPLLISLSLSPHFLLPPSPFSGEAHRRDRHTTGHIGIRRGYGEHDEDPLGAAWKRDSYEGRAARRRPYIPDVHTGRIPVVDTYNRRKELASRYGRDDRTHSRGHRRTAALNHPSLERGRERASGFISTTAKGASIRIWTRAFLCAELVMGPARARKWWKKEWVPFPFIRIVERALFSRIG